MHTRVEKVQVESLVEEIFAQFDSRTCNPRGSETVNWESSLTDFEWIDFWASLYNSEMMDSSNPSAIKH